ncbi:hypothetical protein V6N12_032543 [Hibiscus sabdariffa]|uniref:Secreted protein n=1 Tax=Hibiscus sabdariffa TaxID=183260 RepID=A0ABR2CCW8_9ROSI
MTSFMVVWATAWPWRWEQIGGAMSVALLPVTVVGLGVGVTYGSSGSRGRPLDHKPMLQRRASSTVISTGSASGVGRTVSTESQSAAVKVTTTLWFLVRVDF